MEIDGFKVKKFNQYGLKENSKKSICPLCSHTRKKKTDLCTSLNWEKGIGKCHHCGESFQLHEYEGKNGQVKETQQTHDKPNLNLLRELTDEHRAYLNGRGITNKVIDSNYIQSSFEFITFPYYYKNEIVNTKQRDNNKSFRQSKNCRQTMYRLDAIIESIKEQKEKQQEIKIVICEGEIDALSWVVANCNYATSISQGAPGLKDKSITNKLACIYNDLSILIQADVIYLSCDKDEPGERLKDELTRILQQHCKVFIIDHGNYKDANEVLINSGKKGLHQIFKEAKQAEKLTIELSEPEEQKIIFPVEVFPEFVQELFKHYRDVKNYENSFMGISLMAVIGTIAGSKQVFDSGQYENRCLFMSTMVAPPSTNKSGPMRDMLKPLEFINSQMRSENKTEIDRWEINEEKRDKDPTKENMAKPTWRQLVFENATVEAVHRMHEANEHGLCCKADELRSWFDSLGQYKSSGKGADLGFYLANFNGDSYTINRVKEAMHIDLLHINIVGGIQPDKLSSFPTDNGFLQRFIFALPENKPKLRPRLKIDKDLIQNYNDYITSAYFQFSAQKENTSYELTDNANDLFFDYLDTIRGIEIDKNTSIVFAQFLGKITIVFHRLCLMCRLIDEVFDVMPEGAGFYIGTEHVESAIKLTEYFISTSKTVTSDKDNLRELQRVAYGKGETGKQMILRLIELGIPKKDIERISGKTRQYVHKVITDQYVKQVKK